MIFWDMFLVVETIYLFLFALTTLFSVSVILINSISVCNLTWHLLLGWSSKIIPTIDYGELSLISLVWLGYGVEI